MNDTYIPDNPLIVQSDHSLLLEVHSPRSEAAREAIAPFAELVKSPEHIHTKTRKRGHENGAKTGSGENGVTENGVGHRKRGQRIL